MATWRAVLSRKWSAHREAPLYGETLSRSAKAKTSLCSSCSARFVLIGTTYLAKLRNVMSGSAPLTRRSPFTSARETSRTRSSNAAHRMRRSYPDRRGREEGSSPTHTRCPPITSSFSLIGAGAAMRRGYEDARPPPPRPSVCAPHGPPLGPPGCATIAVGVAMALAGVRVVATDQSVVLYSPYHPEVPPAARRLGGRWTGDAWRFDARDEASVRELARSVYGTDGDDNAPIADARLTVTETVRTLRGSVYFGGRAIASATGRDSGAWLGAGVIQLTGSSPRSGGSSRRWETLLAPGTYEVRDVPEPALVGAPGITWEIVRRPTFSSP